MLARATRLTTNHRPAARDDSASAHRPPQAAEEERAQDEAAQSGHAERQSRSGIVVTLLAPEWPRSSLATQCQALKQPSTSPATSSASVQP